MKKGGGIILGLSATGIMGLALFDAPAEKLEPITSEARSSTIQVEEAINPSQVEEEITDLEIEVTDEAMTKSRDFYENYIGGEGAIVQSDGVAYKALAYGEGEPIGDKSVPVLYTAKKIDGTVFDSTESNGGSPVAFKSSEVIPGLAKVLETMRVGDRFEIAVTAENAYGQDGLGDSIGPNETLIYDVEVLKEKTEAELKTEQEEIERESRKREEQEKLEKERIEKEKLEAQKKKEKEEEEKARKQKEETVQEWPRGEQAPGYSCNCSKTCPNMTSCEEAYFQLNVCGCSVRDGDEDGVPCESIC